MLTAYLRVVFARYLTPLAATLARLGFTPDAITVVGTVGATAGAVVLFTQGLWFAGTMVVWGFVMLDMVDGAVARIVGPSKFGAVLDSTCDRIVDAAIFAAIAWYYAFNTHPAQRAMVLACLICLVLGALTSYIRARAEGVGFTCNVGIAERTERLIIVLVGTFLNGSPLNLPYALAIALWLLVAASAITVVQRLATVYKQAQQREA